MSEHDLAGAASGGASGVQVLTFGCRLNTYESEAMRALATEAGHQRTIVFNTCAVTAEAERQARQAIRKAARENPEATIRSPAAPRRLRPRSGRKSPA